MAEDGVDVFGVPGFGRFNALSKMCLKFISAAVFADAAAAGRAIEQAEHGPELPSTAHLLQSAITEASSTFIKASKRRRLLLERQMMLLDTLDFLSEENV
jgi:hypothetical protein